jgi:hypothetical protein
VFAAEFKMQSDISLLSVSGRKQLRKEVEKKPETPDSRFLRE